MSTPMSRRRLISLVSAAASAGLLAACAPSTSTDGGATSGDPLADDGVKDFVFTGWSLNEASTKGALRSILDQYAGAAGGKITSASYPFNDYLNQVLLQLRGGSLSGAVQVDVGWITTLAATGKLVDLTPLVGKADYTQAALGMGKVGGVQYGLPWTSAGIGLIGNTELLGKAGVAATPKTIAEFEEALRALKGLGGGVIPYAAMTKVDQLKDFISWMWTFGSPVVADGKIVVGDDASVEALTWYKKLYDEKLIAPDVNRFDARALFAQGKVGYYEDAIGGRGAVTKASTDPNLGSKLLPISRPVKNSSDTPQHLAWGHALVVLKGAGSAAAATFASTVTSQQTYSLAWFKQTGLPPTTTAALATAEVKQDAFAAGFTSAIGAYARSQPFWVFPKFAQIEQALAKEVQSALIGKVSPKEALATAKANMQALTA